MSDDAVYTSNSDTEEHKNLQDVVMRDFGIAANYSDFATSPAKPFVLYTFKGVIAGNAHEFSFSVRRPFTDTARENEVMQYDILRFMHAGKYFDKTAKESKDIETIIISGLPGGQSVDGTHNIGTSNFTLKCERSYESHLKMEKSDEYTYASLPAGSGCWWKPYVIMGILISKYNQRLDAKEWKVRRRIFSYKSHNDEETGRKIVNASINFYRANNIVGKQRIELIEEKYKFTSVPILFPFEDSDTGVPENIIKDLEKLEEQYKESRY